MKRRGIPTAVAVVLIALLFGACQRLPGTLFVDVTPEDAYVTVFLDADDTLVHQGSGDVTLTGLGLGVYRVVIGEGADARVESVAVPGEARLELTERTSLELAARPSPELQPKARATGSLELVWRGGRGSRTEEGKRASAELAWLDASTTEGDRGEFRYFVYNADDTLHRAIVARVTTHLASGVAIPRSATTAWFVGVVVEDVKFGGDGHDGGCEAGSCGGDSGGCETGHDDTCGDEHDTGGCGGEGGSGHTPGRGTRLGQIVAVNVHDGGTPGQAGDSIAWRWFEPTLAPTIADLDQWPDLCSKAIIGGNIVVRSR